MSRPARASNVSSAKTGELLFLGSERRILTFRISQYEVFYFVQELNNILDEIRVWGVRKPTKLPLHKTAAAFVYPADQSMNRSKGFPGKIEMSGNPHLAA